MAKQLQSEDTDQDLHFPLAGVDTSMAFDQQPNRMVAAGRYARTTAKATNVRSFDPVSDRMRGGQRPGIVRHVASQISSTNPVQELVSVVITTGIIPGTGQTVSPIFGAAGFFRRADGTLSANGNLASFNSAVSLQADFQRDTVYDIVATRAFLSGSPNTSYTSINIADGTAVAVSLGILKQTAATTAGTDAYFTMSVNGVPYGTATILPGTNPDLNTASAVKSSTYLYVAALQRGAAVSKLMLCAINPDGTVAWSNTNVGTTSEVLPTVGTATYTYPASGASSIQVNGTYILTLFPSLTGMTRAAVADGTSYTVLKTAAQIRAEVDAASGSLPGTGLVFSNKQNFAIAGTVMAITCRRYTSDNEAEACLAFLTTAGSFSPAVLTGIQPSPAIGASAVDGSSVQLDARVISDGTNFYVAVSAQKRGSSPHSSFAVVRKVDGTTGAVMWTTTLTLTTKVTTMAYLSGSAVLEVYGPGFSAQLNVTTGVVIGSGSIGGANAVYAISDGGSVAVGAESIETNPENGPQRSLIGVSEGTAKVLAQGAWASITSGAAAFEATNDVVRAAALGTKVFFADGTNEKYYESANNTIWSWTATDGSLPRDANNGRPRIIEQWRRRILLSGLPRDPYSLYGSRIDDAFDWNIAPNNIGDAARAFKYTFEDVIASVIPFSDDVLFVGCASSLQMLAGSPTQGGQRVTLTDAIGTAWGRPGAKDPYGNLFFMSSRGSIYRVDPRSGAKPIPVSSPIENQFQGINIASRIVRLGWDDEFLGIHVFTTPSGGSGPATHFFWEARSGAWWPEEFADDDFCPTCLHNFDGPTGQVMLMGCRDGYVRQFARAAGDDDGQAIESEVWIGPFLTNFGDAVMLKEIQAVLGETSGPVTYSIHVARTAEGAFTATAASSGTLTGGRTLTFPVMREGHSAYIKLTATNPWSFETIRATIGTRGMIRRRVR